MARASQQKQIALYIVMKQNWTQKLVNFESDFVRGRYVCKSPQGDSRLAIVTILSEGGCKSSVNIELIIPMNDGTCQYTDTYHPRAISDNGEYPPSDETVARATALVDWS